MAERRCTDKNILENNIILGISVTLVLVIDSFIKRCVKTNLGIGESKPAFWGFISITRSENTGAAFGILPGWQWLFILASMIAIGLLMYFYKQLIICRPIAVGTGLAIGGTISNLVDRLASGSVTDYLQVSFWPTFNIADMALTIGIFLIIVCIYILKKEKTGLNCK